MTEIVRLYAKDNGALFALTSEGKYRDILCDVPSLRHYGNLILGEEIMWSAKEISKEKNDGQNNLYNP